MASNDCRRFEDAIASGSRPDDALSEHARTCRQCRALAEIAALRILPVTADQEDPALRSIRAAAARAAARNADRWQRRRGTVPLAIGLAGYTIAALAALWALRPGIISPAVPVWLLGATQVAVPAPGLGEIAAAFAGSAVWTAVVALLARGRRQASDTSGASG